MPMRSLDCDFSPLRIEGSYECGDSNNICYLLCNEAYDISCEYPNFGYREDEVDQIRLGDDDIKFFRDGDGFDVELDDEIREETMTQKKEMLDKVNKIAKENAIKKKKNGNRKWQKLDKNKILGPYARHVLEFKIRKEAGYIESSTDEEDSILSDCESLKSRANSSDEEDQEVQSRKDVRYVKFNEKNMQDPKLFVGLVFSSKAPMKEFVTWYSVLYHKPLWLASNDNQRFNVKCTFPCNFSLWIAKDDKLSETDWVVKR
ncbi:hypothetical protein LIER_11809 [Lithospermum erythrorhizon]|uniref:Uncharacterized protein n=1 Tax=Lithospermum erythrorhizon TaxID=34254 RepID=A0AAV3PRD8_LITER